MKNTKLITVAQEPLLKIFSMLNTESITLEAFHDDKGTLPATLQLSRVSRSGGSIHHNSPQHEEYMAPEDLQQVTLLCFACKSRVTVPECAPE